MCSWCYGFQPTIRALVERHYAITVALGSLGSDRARPMRDANKAEVRQHWEHVCGRSGQPFDFRFFDRDGFVYDTAPPCRAVAIVRGRFPALAVPFLGRLQERFYALGQDITDAAILREAVGEFGIDPAVFDKAFRDPATAAEINAEWQQTAALGVTGYPTLLALEPGKPRVITIGWRPTGEVIEHVAGLAKKGRMAADRR
jgi:putative protein-disulfide isomerase